MPKDRNDTGIIKSYGPMKDVAPAPTNMRSSRTYPSRKGGNQFPAPEDHPQAIVDGVGGQDQRGSKRTYPSKKSGNTFRTNRGSKTFGIGGVSESGGGNYLTKGV